MEHSWEVAGGSVKPEYVVKQQEAEASKAGKAGTR